MKRVFTLFLLALFLLNVLGFYGVFLGMELQNARLANNLLDEDRYSGSDAITFKLPLTIPYAFDDDEYQRVTGEFEHNGEVFRLVKQKLYRDTLYVVCVKDREGKKIKQAMADYVKTFTDKPANAKQQNNKIQIPTFIKDYLTTGVTIQSQSSGWKSGVASTQYSRNYSAGPDARIKYPPRSLSLS